MFLRKSKYNLLEKAISELNKTLQDGNIHELSYLLGSKKEMIVRKKYIKGCITENKKHEAQIRTRLKRLWPKTIVEYKKINRKRLHSQKIKGQIIGPGPCR